MGLRVFFPVLLLAVLLALPASAARSAQWIADRDIGNYCQQYLTRPNSPSGAVCLSYIQGFLDGLRTTETPAFPLPEEVRDTASAEEEAVISAQRMNALVEEYGPPARAGICLPADLQREEVVRVIARALRYGRSSGRSALDDYAQAALQERYPCDPNAPLETVDENNEQDERYPRDESEGTLQ